MQLVGDRFVEDPRGVVDLATGARVRLVRRAWTARAGLREWQERCADLLSVRHTLLVPLMDALPTGEASGLEIYPETAGPAGSARARREAQSAVAAFLVARGLPWRAEDVAVRGTEAAAARTVGVVLGRTAALDGAVAALDAVSRGDTRLLPVRAPRGAGLTTLLGIVARAARERGLCPVCPECLLDLPGVGGLLRGRTLALLVDRGERRAGDALAAAFRAGCDVAVVVGAVPAGVGDAALELQPFAAGDLACRLEIRPSLSHRRLTGLVRSAGGLPGVAVRLALGGAAGTPLPPRVEHIGRVERGRGSTIARDGGAGWPRRGADRPARLREGWVALREANVAGAASLFGSVLSRPVDGGQNRVRAEALVGLGLAELDRADLDRARAALTAARALAVIAEAEPERASAELALARLFLWRNEPARCAAMLESVKRGPAREGSDRVGLLRLEARLAAARGRVGPAIDLWRRAAAAAGEGGGRAAVACDLARLHLTMGDAAACGAHLKIAAAHARRAGRRRRLIIGTITLACRTRCCSGGPGEAKHVRAAHRLLAGTVPALVRLRARRAMEDAGWRRGREVTAFVSAWGGRVLDGMGVGYGGESRRSTGMLRELQTVIEICRDTGDPLPALGKVCWFVHERLGASLVGVYGGPPHAVRLAQAGQARLDRPDLVRRVLDSGHAVPPGTAPDGSEAAVPVSYGGRTIGAVACRWAAGREIDPAAAETLLAGAATALAPHLQGALDAAAPALPSPDEALGLLGESAAMGELRARIRRVAAAPFHVLIEGESGSGKELVARAIHQAGPRRRRRFCAVNCAALTDELLEAELFGHARGAFTGAVGERAGLFEEADGGTLFLDEVGELSLRAQAKLLRVIQDGDVRRLGENLARRVDARIVAATNRSLAEEQAAGRFRADLLYRLDVIRIAIPPLRERSEDVPLLAQASWTEAAARIGSRATLHARTLAVLSRHHWPGNVRELQNVIRALAVNAPHRGVVLPDALPPAIAAAAVSLPVTLDEARRHFEERFVRAALARASHRPCQAARDLGVTRQGLRKLLRRLGIEPTAPVRHHGLKGRPC